MAASRRADRSQLSGATLQFMQQLWELVHALDVRSKRMARELGVTGPQRLVIRVLGQKPDSTATEVSGALGLHPSTLTGILKRLELRGIVQRAVDLVDRRRARFRLTKKGHAIDHERRGTVEASVKRALGRADATTIKRSLNVLELLTSELARRD